MITTHKLAKSFPGRGRKGKTVEAVRGIDLDIREGEVYGLLGPNGAGKTTTMRMLATLITPSGGSATVAGFELAAQPHEIRKRLGYVSQKGGMERTATGRENLILQGQLYGLPRAAAEARALELMQHLELESFADRRTETYSGGQRRIFDLAVGIFHKPQVLFLDEPTTGLDPQSRAKVWREVRRIQAEGTTIVLTTHYLEEADGLCDRIAIIDHGEIIRRGTPAALKDELASDVVTLELDAASQERTKTLLRDQPYVRELQATDEGLQVFVDKGETALIEIIRLLDGASIEAHAVRFSEPTLDDVFLKLTGHSLRDDGEQP